MNFILYIPNLQIAKLTIIQVLNPFDMLVFANGIRSKFKSLRMSEDNIATR